VAAGGAEAWGILQLKLASSKWRMALALARQRKYSAAKSAKL
jgi:hypothetical protein